MKLLRTPDDRFRDLPGYSFSPQYAEVSDGEGEELADPMVCFISTTR